MIVYLRTVQIAPMTSTTKSYPWRASILFQDKKGMIAPDQIRTIDKQRLLKKLGDTSSSVHKAIKEMVNEMLVS